MKLDARELEEWNADEARRDRQLAIIASLLGIVMTIGWIVFDRVLVPEHKTLLLEFRLVEEALCAIALVLSWRARGPAAQRYAGLFFVTGLFALVGAMLPFAGASFWLYVINFSLFYWAGGLMLTWPVRTCLIAYLPSIAAFGAGLAISAEPRTSNEVLGSTTFLVSVAMIAILTIHLRRRLMLQAFRARSDLRRLGEAKEAMFQNVSHELRTPLTLIMSPLDSLIEQRGELPAWSHRPLETIQRNSLRLLHQIDALLDLGRAKTKGWTVSPRVIALGPWLSQLCDDIQPSAEARGVHVTTQIAEGLRARLDPDLLERAVLNLVSNALKFTGKGGEIAIGARTGEGGLAISVRDTGTGIPQEVQARIFDRFEQADPSTSRRHGGTGIGLALVKDVTEAMGGTVELASKPGVGSTFTLGFPPSVLTDADAQASDEPVDPSVALARRAARAALGGRAGTPSDEVVRAGTRGPRVLVVEDDPDLNDELVRILAPRHRVASVRNGEIALAIAIDEVPDVVLSDVMLPGRDGISLVEAIRERSELRNTPCVLLSARIHTGDRVRGRKAGADSYLTKPFEPAELVACVEGVLRARMRLIGSFLVHDLLGSGAQSDVYRAEHVESGEIAALKVVKHTGDLGRKAREQLLREQRILRAAIHPNVVRVLDTGEQEGGFYIAMERLCGSTLGDACRNRRLPPPAITAIGTAVASAIDDLAQHGVVHRDIKPGNIMIVEGTGSLASRVRLIDFGIAKELADIEPAKVVLGTPMYVAPELFRGEAATPVSDLYSLGVMLFRLATGTTPFGTRGGDSLIDAIREGKLPSAHEIVPAVPRELADVIAKAMARDPQQRYPTGAALAAALAGFRGDAEPIELADDKTTQMPVEPATVREGDASKTTTRASG